MTEYREQSREEIISDCVSRVSEVRVRARKRVCRESIKKKWENGRGSNSKIWEMSMNECEEQSKVYFFFILLIFLSYDFKISIWRYS